MKVFHSLSKLALPLLFLSISLFSLETKAQVLSLMTSASMCDLRNIGNGKARQGMIRENGTINNILNDLNIPIYCPLTIEFDKPKYEVAIRALNGNSSTQRFRCVVSEYDINNFKIRSVAKSLNLQGGFADTLYFPNLRMSSVTNRLDMRCEMPPRGGYGWIAMDSYYF